jgi:hypothetical protein
MPLSINSMPAPPLACRRLVSLLLPAAIVNCATQQPPCTITPAHPHGGAEEPELTLVWNDKEDVQVVVLVEPGLLEDLLQHSRSAGGA